MSASALADVLSGPGCPLFAHRDPEITVLPYLREHLPSAITQEYLTRNARPPYVVFATYPPTASPPRDGTWSTAVLDPTCRNETGLWFWSSVESALVSPSIDNVELSPKLDSLFQTAQTHLDKILSHIATLYTEIDSLIIGNLHSAFTPFMKSQPSTTRVSENWAKMIYTPEALPPPSSALSEDEYRFGQIEERHLDEVLSTSSVARGRATVLTSPNTAIFSRATDEPLAWCFTSREGSVSTLYVRPEARGRGLGKAAMRAELVRAFERDGRPFGSVEVSLTNEASLGLSESMGARKRWEVVWATVNLEALRRTAAAPAS
ncbi:hypothetical protein PENSPDRAFT_758842 [Peniophora sp. CONT]|nr:hypothetical protein PENSPDRAFT_758842 [Peniophora sp. CONT]